MELPTREEQEAIVKQILHVNSLQHPQAYLAFFDYYTSIICSSAGEVATIQIDNLALRSHTEVLNSLKYLYSNPSLTRQEFEDGCFASTSSARDREDATRKVVRVGLMLDCSLKDKYSKGFEVNGYSPPKWRADETLDHFVDQTFPKQQMHGLEIQSCKRVLRAWKLKKRYNIKFQPTDNLAEHLLHDPVTRTVKVFHHTTYLKAHLARTMDQPIELDTRSSLKLYHHYC